MVSFFNLDNRFLWRDRKLSESISFSGIQILKALLVIVQIGVVELSLKIIKPERSLLSSVTIIIDIKEIKFIALR